MVDAWPATLPQYVQAESFQQSLGEGRVRYPNDTGPATVRRRSSAVVLPLQCVVQLTAAQWVTLVTFVETTLMGGALPFTFPDPDGGTALLVRFSDAKPSRVPLGPDVWKVTLPLEVLP